MQVYRPEWTCGRYDEGKRVAIVYNLIEGLSYLFEDESAQVVASFILIPRWSSISVAAIAEHTSIDLESVSDFIRELKDVGLVADHRFTDVEISEYRQRVSESRILKTQTEVRTTKEKLPFELSTTETEYADKVGGITSIMIELTYRCSEQCLHCYNIGATRNDTEVSHRSELDELTLGDYRRIIDQLYDQGLFKVCLSGGDPFSKPIVWDIIEYLYEKDIVFQVFTNGQRIVNDVSRLASYYPCLVGVSLYSGNAVTHDLITRVKGSWERSMSVIKQLSSLSVPIELKCCVMRPNVRDYQSVMDVAKNFGAVVQYELNVTDSIEGDRCVSQYLRLTPEMLDVVLQDDNTPMYVGKEAPNFGGEPRPMDVNACGAGQTSFCITPDGDLIPCCALHLSFGNLRKQSVREVVCSTLLHKWQSLTLERYEDCGRYDYCSYCNLCPGVNYAEHGTVTKAGENNCYMAKCRHSLAQRLMAGERALDADEVRAKLALMDNSIGIPRRVYDQSELER